MLREGVVRDHDSWTSNETVFQKIRNRNLSLEVWRKDDPPARHNLWNRNGNGSNEVVDNRSNLHYDSHYIHNHNHRDLYYRWYNS